MMVGVALPTCVIRDSGVGLIVFVSFSELEVAAILEAEVFAAGGDDGVVPRKVETAGGRPVHCEGIVEKGAVSVGLAGVFELLKEATEFLCLKAVVRSEIAPAVGFLDVVGQAVGVVETDGPSEQILGSPGVFPAHHVGGDACGITEEGEEDEFVDGLKVGSAIADGNFEIQVVGIDCGKGRIDPLFGFMQLDLGIADRVEVLLERFAVADRELAVERVDVGDEEVESAFAAGKFVTGFPSLGDEEEIKDFLGSVDRGDGAAFLVEGRSVSGPGCASPGIGGKDERRVAGVVADVCGDDLIERDRVFVGSFASGFGTSEVLVCIGVAVDFASGGMGEAGVNRDLAAQRFEDIENLGEAEVAFASLGEPAPVLPGGVILPGQAHSVRMVDAHKAGHFFPWLFFGGKGLHPGEGEANAGALKELSSFHEGSVIGHRLFLA